MSEMWLFLTGHVSWDEYKIKFLASKGFNEKEIAEKIRNNEELKIDEESKCRLLVCWWFFFYFPKTWMSKLFLIEDECISCSASTQM